MVVICDQCETVALCSKRGECLPVLGAVKTEGKSLGQIAYEALTGFPAASWEGVDAWHRALYERGAQAIAAHARAEMMAQAAPAESKEEFSIAVFCAGSEGFVPLKNNGVRVTHNATGIYAECSEQRSHHANKAAALDVCKKLVGGLAVPAVAAPPLKATS